MSKSNSQSRVTPVHVAFGIAGLLLLLLFVGFLLLATTRFVGVGSGEDEVAIRALPAAPPEAPPADQYQPFEAIDDGQERQRWQLLDDPDVVVDSIEPIGVAIGPVGDREFYRYKARMEPSGEVLRCVGEYGETGGGSSCGGGGDMEPGVGGGSSQSGNGPIIEYSTVEGLGPDAAWALFELGSGFSIVSEVRGGIASVEWVGNGERVAQITVYSAELDELWSR